MKLSCVTVVVMFLALMVICFDTKAETPAEKLADKKDDAWFGSADGLETMANILSWQTELGDWPKNTDTTKKFHNHDTKPAGTFDNAATVGELRVLARAFRVTGDERYKKAFLVGFDHILKAQYSNGGWPQFYPAGKGYHRHITFNDGTMIGLMEILQEATTDVDSKLVDTNRRAAATKAIQQAIKCIIKCQIVVDGVPTVWCAQHHAETLLPVLARSYEHPSLSGAESAGVLRFLMKLDNPSPDVIAAVKAGVAWFESAKVKGHRYQRSKTEPALIRDDKARLLWARFYEIQTNRPIFSDRDGIIKYNIQQIGSERRNGYAWYGNWGENVLKAYKKWPHR